MTVSRPRPGGIIPVGGQAQFAGVDQGIDYTGAGPVYAEGDGTITRLQNYGSGWPGQGALLVYKLKGLQKWIYVAEDFLAKRGLRVGSTVHRGEVIGQATGSGLAPGIETGWAYAGGTPIAPLLPHGANYGNGPGANFAAFVGQSGSTPRSRRGNGYDARGLASLWQQAGGDASIAPMTAAIALAESSGDPQARNVNLDGSVDRGLWQINSTHLDSDVLFNPLTNAQWAVRVYNEQGLRAWTTYKTGAYKAYLDPSATTAGPGGTVTTQPSRTRPGDNGLSVGSVAGMLDGLAGGPVTIAEQGFEAVFGGGIGNPLDVFKGLIWLMKPQSWLRMVEFLAGFTFLMLSFVGLAVMFVQRSGTVGKAAGVAAMLPGPVGAAGKAVTAVRRPQTAARQYATRKRAAGRAADRRERDELDQHFRERADELDPRRRARAEQRDLRNQERSERMARVNEGLAAARARRPAAHRTDEVPF